MALCKSVLIYTILSVFLFHCDYLYSYQSANSLAVSYSPKNKQKIAVFPFKNNTNIPNLQKSIPDLLRGELFRAGYFEIVENKKLYNVIWRIGLSNFIKIDNTGAGDIEKFIDQDVDIYSQLDRDVIEKISVEVDADYSIKGSANQFGGLIRIEIDLLDIYKKITLDSLSAEVRNVEDIPNAIKGFIPTITFLCLQVNIEDIVDEAYAQYQEGLISFEVTVSNLKEIALFAPGSVYATARLLTLYMENGFEDDAIEICENLISSSSEFTENSIDVFMRTGIDPFEIRASFYEDKGMFGQAADVYEKAAKTYPFNKAVYYKKLGINLIKLGKLNEAIDALQNSTGLDLMDFDAHYQLAAAYESAGRISEAIEEYKQCLKYTGGRIHGLPIDEVKKKIQELK